MVPRMLVHGRDKLHALADRCGVEELEDTNGWIVHLWRMDEDDVDAAVSIYAAVLAGGVEVGDPVLALLETAGLDLPALLEDGDATKDDITRSDLTEFVAAASMLALDEADADRMHMPNVPKMSRRKSDSGVDVFDVALDLTANPADDLGPDECLKIASVKHSIQESTGNLRWQLVESLSSRDLSHAYLAAQLRVLNGRLQQGGMARPAASRVYLFMRDFPHSEHVELVAVGVVAPESEAHLLHHVTLLPEVSGARRVFRAVLLPDLPTVHERCP